MIAQAQIKYFNYVPAPFMRRLFFLFFRKHLLCYSPVKNLIVSMRVCRFQGETWMYDTTICLFGLEDAAVHIAPLNGDEGFNA